MNVMSKFKEGDLCKVLYGQRIWYREERGVFSCDLHPEYVGQTVLINYTYKDEYGGDGDDSYAVTFMTGDMTGKRISWYRNEDLELVDHTKLVKGDGIMKQINEVPFHTTGVTKKKLTEFLIGLFTLDNYDD